jgi:hypothetical protein
MLGTGEQCDDGNYMIGDGCYGCKVDSDVNVCDGHTFEVTSILTTIEGTFAGAGNAHLTTGFNLCANATGPEHYFKVHIPQAGTLQLFAGDPAGHKPIMVYLRDQCGNETEAGQQHCALSAYSGGDVLAMFFKTYAAQTDITVIVDSDASNPAEGYMLSMSFSPG